MSARGFTLGELCAVACAEAFRGDGEILASGIGTIPTIGARLAKATFAPDLLLTDGIASLVVNPLPVTMGGDPPYPPARPVGAPASAKIVEGWMPYRSIFDVVWSGRRHVMMGATQIDSRGNQNISCIGPFERPKAQLLGMRGAPGNTINHATSYWVPAHSTRSFVPKVDVVSGVGWDRAAALGEKASRFVSIRRVVSNKGVFDFETGARTMRLRSVHPGVSVDDIVKSTGFPLLMAEKVIETRAPTDEELRLIREVLDPTGLADREVKA